MADGTTWEERRERFTRVAAKLTGDAERPLPTIEEFAALLYSRPDGEAGHAKRALLLNYASVWARYEGVSTHVAMKRAHELADELRDDETREAEAPGEAEDAS